MGPGLIRQSLGALAGRLVRPDPQDSPVPFAVFREAVERSKSGEAFSYLSAVRSAQERYHARQGAYAHVKTDLDINFPEPKYFSLWEITDSEANWGLTLQRTGKSAGYGAYTVLFTELGYSTDSNIPAVINAMAAN